MKKLSLILVLTTLILSGCKKEEVYEEIRFISVGNEAIGYCGLLIETEDVGSFATRLKPIDVPDIVIPDGGERYWVKLKFLNKTFKCNNRDLRIEPNPKDPPMEEEVKIEMVEILEIRLIE